MDIINFNSILVNVISALLGAGVFALIGWATIRTALNKDFRQARNRIRRGAALQANHQLDLAREELMKSVEILSDRTRSVLLSEAYLRLGDISLEMGNFDEAINDYTFCQQLSIELKHSISKDVLLLRLGRAYIGAKKFDDAYKCFDDVQQMTSSMENGLIAATAYMRLGEVESYRGRTDAAIDYYLRALGFQERIRDRRAQASTRLSLADLNLESERHTEAVNHYTEARTLYEEIGDRTVVAMIDGKLGEVQQSASVA